MDCKKINAFIKLTITQLTITVFTFTEKVLLLRTLCMHLFL